MRKKIYPSEFQHRKVLALVWLLPTVIMCQAQMKHPVKWSFDSKQEGGTEVTLYFKASIDDGWHIYSTAMEQDGPTPTSFKFFDSPDFELVGTVKEESQVHKAYNPIFFMDLLWYEREAIFSQRIRMHSSEVNLTGELEFMACSENECLLPETVPFEFNVHLANVGKRTDPPDIRQQEEPKSQTIPSDTLDSAEIQISGEGMSRIKELNEEEPEGSSFFGVFLAGLLGGFAAIFMPCIFPMLPLTIGYFAKRGTTRRGSVGIGLLYGLSIVVIYVSLGLGVSIVFGSEALNSIASNGLFNGIFFILLLLFGFSLLGGFELTLPSSWVNKVNDRADRKGFLSIFFMAATLAMVSFSCTGPLIGTLLVETASTGEYINPALGMLGFSLALAFPFSVFSMFPSWLRSLPKSGHWLNDVKVVLGFLELALALKFLSNVDLAYHWNVFDRDIFLVAWIIIFLLIGLYLLSKLILTSKPAVRQVTPLSLILAMCSLGFALYMIPGLFGAPLTPIAAFLPPLNTQDFNLYQLKDSQPKPSNKKYAELFHAPAGFDAYFDYDEGMDYARQTDKPVLLDFTGHTCINCRKMETNVWSEPEVLDLIREEFILIQLYVDDKTRLSPREFYISSNTGRVIKSIGGMWSDLQTSLFRTNSQPYYVLLDPETEAALVPPTGALFDPNEYLIFLRSGLSAYRRN